MTPEKPARSRKGKEGSPGTIAKPTSTTVAIPIARGCAVSSRPRSTPRLLSEVVRVIMMPAAMEVMRAGIWETRPSPIVRIV
jgi:hypothetical protein